MKKVMSIASLLFTLCFLTLVNSPVLSQTVNNYKTYDGLKEEFLIDLPEGWAVFD